MISLERWEKLLVQDLVLFIIGGLFFFLAFGLLFSGLSIVFMFAGLGLMIMAAFDACRLIFFQEVKNENTHKNVQKI